MNARTDQISQYNPVYDLIRGVAAMVVFLGHTYPLWNVLSGIAFKGDIVYASLFLSVEFFFALSGVLLGPILYQQFQKKEPFKNVKVFLLRRWYRTLPTFYLGLAFWLTWYTPFFAPEGAELPHNLLEYFLFVQNLFGQYIGFFNVAWSISVEEIFYVVFVGLVGACFLRYGNAERSFKLTILIIFFFSFMMRAFALQDFSDWDMEIRKASLLRLDSIAMGAFVGIYCTNLTRQSFLNAMTFILITVFYLSSFWHDIKSSALHILLLQLMFTFLPFACAIIVKYLADNWKLEPSKRIRFFADISYPLYIFHLALVPYFYNIGLEASYLLLIAYIIGTIGFCYLFFRFIETPILKRRPRYES